MAATRMRVHLQTFVRGGAPAISKRSPNEPEGRGFSQLQLAIGLACRALELRIRTSAAKPGSGHDVAGRESEQTRAPDPERCRERGISGGRAAVARIGVQRSLRSSMARSDEARVVTLTTQEAPTAVPRGACSVAGAGQARLERLPRPQDRAPCRLPAGSRMGGAGSDTRRPDSAATPGGSRSRATWRTARGTLCSGRRSP
jgi:hypothetical protein